MRYEITKVNPWSLARVTSLIAIAISIVISLPYIAVGLLFSGGLRYFDFGVWMIGGVLGFFAVVYILGLLSGFTTAFVYNWIAEYQKGIEINIDIVEGQEE